MIKNNYIICEVASIHEGDKKYLEKLIVKAKLYDGDGIKFQPFDVDELVSPSHQDYKFYKESSFDAKDWDKLINFAFKKKIDVWIDCFTDFSFKLINRNKKKIVGVKINLSLIYDHRYIDKINKIDKKILIPLSGVKLLEIFILLDKLANHENIIFMHGYQSFPKNENKKGGPPKNPIIEKDLELWKLEYYKKVFPKFNFGLSDHLGSKNKNNFLANIIASSMGVTYFEKHIQLEHNSKREDYYNSINVSKVRDLKILLNDTNTIIGNQSKNINIKEIGYTNEMKKTLTSSVEINQNKMLKQNDYSYQRTGNYVSTSRLDEIINKKANKKIKVNSTLKDSYFNQNIGIFCNARSSSSRLPEKALLKFYKNTPSIIFLLNRINDYLKINNFAKLIFATTTNSSDDKLSKLVTKNNFNVFRGSNFDVMKRMIKAAEKNNIDVFIRVTGDDILVSCEHMYECLNFHLENSSDFTKVEGLPIGMSFEIIKISSLKRVHKYIANKNLTEYLTYFLDNSSLLNVNTFKIKKYKNSKSLNCSLTLDTIDDFNNLQKLVKLCHADNRDPLYIGTDNIINNLKFISTSNYTPKKLPSEIDTNIVYQYD